MRNQIAEMKKLNEKVRNKYLAKYVGVFYINLSITKRDEGDQVTENYIKRTAESFQQTHSVNINDILTPEGDNRGGRYMLYGAAGTGKSTVSQIMAYKWGKQELWNHLDFVFHLECRKLTTDITNDKQYTLEELLLKFHCPDVALLNNLSQEFLQYITTQHNKVMIIIDGLDELPKWAETVKNQQNDRIVIKGIRQTVSIPNLLYCLITGELMENIIVLVTSGNQGIMV